MKKVVYASIFAIAIFIVIILYAAQTESVKVVVESGLKQIESDRVAERVKTMSLDEKIGQLMMIGFVSSHADEHILRMISEYHVGGVNLLRRNVVSADQTKGLVKKLREASASSTDVMFLVATDQEGGNYSRFSFLPYQKPQTALSGPESAYEEALGRGVALKALGIDANFSPVVDYVSGKKTYLYGRTFGTTSDQIAPLARAMIKGYERSGILSVIKHFPGYGNIAKDPHAYDAASDDVALYDESLVPFRDLLYGKKEGAVMTAHIIISHIDSKPATLSERFLKGIIRDEWNFGGVIISDDLEMASAGKMPVPQLAVEAIKAGNDMIISTFTPSFHPLIHDAIKRAVKEGYISAEQIDRSVERILLFKGY